MILEHDVVKLLSSPDGEQVALHELGGDGPALLLGHGNGLNTGMWAGALPTLTEHFHCFGVDLRGHGASRPINRNYSVKRERFAEDVLSCVDAIGGPVHFAGHSLGAASAVFAALARRDAFRTLWLFEPVLMPIGYERGSDGPSFLVKISRRRRMEFESVDDAFERFTSKPPYSGCDPRSVRSYIEVGSYPVDGGIRLSCEGEDEARVYESADDMDFDRFAAIDAPTVVASGGSTDEANALPPKLAPLVAAALGNAVSEEYPTLSHFGPMEAPEVVAASIIANAERS